VKEEHLAPLSECFFDVRGTLELGFGVEFAGQHGCFGIVSIAFIILEDGEVIASINLYN
jgi:hypothetical protein